MKLNFTVASDRGLVRGNNEDSAYAGPRLLALADGMGGHAAGEVASQIMISHLRVLDADTEDNDMLALLGTIADDANTAIAEEVAKRPETAGMGTTCTTLLFDGTRFGLLHVGDSRGYRLRDGELERITRDDTYVQSLVDEGQLDAEDVSTHPQRSLILKAYTGQPVEPTLHYLDARVGDRILLCSDGLSDPVTFETIQNELSKGSPKDAAIRLIELALRSGGPDNVTVVIADVVAGDKEAPELPVTAGAINIGEPENPRPNTSAGRAATMVERSNQPIEVPEAANTKKRPWIGLVIAIVVIGLLAGLGFFGMKMRDNYFFVATENDRIVIEQGFNIDVFGKPLHEVYQVACLDRDGKLKVVDKVGASCAPFKLTDLKPDTRSSIKSLPMGSYDEVMRLMTRLSEETLPACVKREGMLPEQSQAGDLNSPGVNCREVAQ